MEASCGQRERRPIDAGSSLGPDAAPKGCIGMVSQIVDQDVDIDINIDGDVDVDIDLGMTALTPSCSAAKQPKQHSSKPLLISWGANSMHACVCTLFATVIAEAAMLNKQQFSSRTRHSTQAIESEKNEQDGKE